MRIRSFNLIVLSSVFNVYMLQAQSILFAEGDIELHNRQIISIDGDGSTLSLNNQRGDGMALIKNVQFDTGVIELEIRGENNPGKSFVGVAFNIENDSTFEAVYFRPFNFQSEEQIRREHSVQYICEPKNTWRYLRDNYEGQYEAEFPRQPDPDNWFAVRIKIDESLVTVYDTSNEQELLSVERLRSQKSDRIGMWTGFNSKGDFRNVKIEE